VDQFGPGARKRLRRVIEPFADRLDADQGCHRAERVAIARVPSPKALPISAILPAGLEATKLANSRRTSGSEEPPSVTRAFSRLSPGSEAPGATAVVEPSPSASQAGSRRPIKSSRGAPHTGFRLV
jgi:hypothetical protein